MYRYTTEGNNTMDANEENEIQDELNLSSSMSMQTTQSGSKAVLAALRALQDKIRRLDTERAASVDECDSLKAQIKSMEVDFEHMKQRDSLLSNQALLEQRASNEALKTEAAERETEYLKLTERHREQGVELNKAKIIVDTLEEEKASLLAKSRRLEQQCTEQDDLLRKYSSKERDLSAWALAESRRHEAELDMAIKRVKEQQNNTAVARDEYTAATDKVKELEKLVAQLLGVNDSLVRQLAGRASRPFVHSQAIHPSRPLRPYVRPSPYAQSKLKITKKGTKKQASKSPKASSSTAPTPSVQFPRHTFPSQDHIDTVLRSSNTEELKLLHGQFSTLYKKVKSTPTSSPKKGGGTTKGRKSGARTKTRLRKSRESTSSMSDAFMTSTATGVATATGSRSVPPSPAAALMSKSTIDLHLPSPRKSVEDILRPASAPAPVVMPTPAQSKSPLHPAMLETQAGSQAVQQPSGGALGVVLASLEEEHASLAQQYTHILKKAQDAGVTEAPAYADDLMSLAAKMKRKQEQIAGLKG